MKLSSYVSYSTSRELTQKIKQYKQENSALRTHLDTMHTKPGTKSEDAVRVRGNSLNMSITDEEKKKFVNTITEREEEIKRYQREIEQLHQTIQSIQSSGDASQAIALERELRQETERRLEKEKNDRIQAEKEKEKFLEAFEKELETANMKYDILVNTKLDLEQEVLV